MTTVVTVGTPDRGKRRRRRRRAFSLNGLAIQLSAFALSFTLVALLVVTGSQAAFVEENEIVTNHVPLALPEDGGNGGPGPRPAPLPRSSPSPSTSAVVPASPSPLPVGEAPAEETPSPANSLMELTDTDADTAMFTDGTVLAPGSTHSRCITVAYVGAVDPSAVRLYAAQVAGDLAPFLDVVIDLGPANSDAFGSCAAFVPSATVYSGTLADFAAGHAAFGSGVPTWQPVGSDGTRSFRFSLTVRDDPQAEGRTASFGFTWEVRADG
jgi:hypothetical protein